jgi:hypothetical protein
MLKPSPYVEFDPTLEAWATQHGLHIATRARDEEVRVASVVDDAGDTYQIWITPSDEAVAVDAALLRRAVGRTASRDRDKFVFHEVVSRTHVRLALDAAFDQVCSWIAQSGQSRTQI